MTPLVSILIPAFNCERSLAETIRSALEQTWPFYEVIILDDGSTDRTLEIARRFESNIVAVHTQRNRGAAVTRNTLFALSRGDYIQWLDADDLLSPNKIAAQMGSLRRIPRPELTLLSSSWAYFYFRPGKAIFTPTALWCDLSPQEWMIRKFEHNLHMQTATWLVSRHLSDRAGPWDSRLLSDDDGDYFSRVLLASDGTVFVPEAKVYYRRTGCDSLSYIGRSDKKLEALWLSMRLGIGYLTSLDDSDRARASCVRYLQTWLPLFYPERPDLSQAIIQMASELGETLHPPRLPWKYAWLQQLCGWNTAKQAQRILPQIKSNVRARWDRTMHQLQAGPRS